MAQSRQTVNELVEGPLWALVSGVVYYTVFRLNELLDPWTLYAQGINLVFLPAGVKHVAILVARGWGALGCFVALMLLAFEFWSGASGVQILLYSATSTLATWLGLELAMRFMRIDKDLSNLRFTHLPYMDLVTTALHGFLVNGYFMAVGMKSERFVENALAMMVGDFMGSFLVLMVFWSMLGLVDRFRKKPG